jgi:nucleoside-triphosphatase THEP1
MAIYFLNSRNTAHISSKDVIAELLLAIIRKATKENKICIIDDVAAKLNFKLKEV